MKRGRRFCDLVLVQVRAGGMPQLVKGGVLAAHKQWLNIREEAEAMDPPPAKQDLPMHPLAPLVGAWQMQKHVAKPERRAHGILPVSFSLPLPNAVSKVVGQLTPPPAGGAGGSFG